MSKKIDINNNYYISEISASDKPAYLEHLQEKQIYNHTLRIPFPYTESDADFWVKFIEEETRKQGRSVNWAIRRNDNYLIGGIGFSDLELGISHRAELGYWLAKPYWNQGIMTQAVKNICEIGFQEFGLVRISANIFAFNTGSGRVLEKAGFQQEGYLRKYYKKDEKFLDGILYSKIK